MKTFVTLSLALLLSTSTAVFAAGFSSSGLYVDATNDLTASATLNLDGINFITPEHKRLAGEYINAVLPNRYEAAFYFIKPVNQAADFVASKVPAELPAWSPVSKSDLVKTAAVILAEGYRRSDYQKAAQHGVVNLGIDTASGILHAKALEYANKFGLQTVTSHVSNYVNTDKLGDLAKYVAYKTIRFGVHKLVKDRTSFLN